MIEPRGWVLYDGSCPICSGGAERFHRILHARGFGLAPLQTPWVQDRLNLKTDTPLEEMRVITHDHRILGGADGLIYLSAQVWWAWPVFAIAQLPGMRSLAWGAYRWIAKRRYCLGGVCQLHAVPTASHSAFSLLEFILHPVRKIIVFDQAMDGTHAPFQLWTSLVGIAVGGSAIYGASLHSLFPEWQFSTGALWIVLSAGLSWCLYIPALWLWSSRKFSTCVQASLVTMAYGELVLTLLAILNLIIWRSGMSMNAGYFNVLCIALSNLLMVIVLAKQMSSLGFKPWKTIVLWTAVLDGCGLLLFWIFRQLLRRPL